MSTVNEKMTALADAIREKSGTTGALTLEQMTTEVQSLEVGSYEEGKTAEWNEFWDVVQENGNRTIYNNSRYNSFDNYCWTDRTFRPKYDIKPSGSADGCFQRSKIQNFKECLAYNNVKLDLSNCTSMYQFFNTSSITTVGEIDLSAMPSGSISGMFQNCYYLSTVELLKVKETNTFDASVFQNCSALKEIRFSGTITGVLNFSYTSSLTAESAKSIILCLKNYTEAGETTTNTLTLNSATWSSLEASEAAPNGDTWKNYVATLGWTAV